MSGYGPSAGRVPDWPGPAAGHGGPFPVTGVQPGYGAGAPVSGSPGAGPRPGWYHDPSGAPVARWWDGRAWTAHVEPLGARPPGGAQPQLDAGPRNPLATMALVLGIGSLFLNPFGITSIAGMVFSGIGMSNAWLLQHQGHPARGLIKAMIGLGLAVLGAMVQLEIHGLLG